MPDEQCRICGNLLRKYFVCAVCRGVVKQICIMCGKTTVERQHDECFYDMNRYSALAG